MYYFKAEQEGSKIIISSNTHWNCKVDGNCLLSKCNGIGNDVIKIIVPRELPSASGAITFSYGDERCSYPEIDVYLLNDCYISTIPSYSVCKEGNVLLIPFYYSSEKLTITVLSNGIWTTTNLTNCKIVINGDELVIIPKNKNDGSLEIIPNIGCKENHVIVKLKYSGD